MDIGNNPLGRRHMLAALGSLPFVAWSYSASAAQCFDPNKLPNAGLRKSLNFKAVSSDSKKNCAACAFFTATSNQSECGKCVLFAGGPVSRNSVCDSWAAKR